MQRQEDIVEPPTAQDFGGLIPFARPVTWVDPSRLPPPPPDPPFLLPGLSRREAMLDLLIFICLFAAIALGGEVILATYFHNQLAPMHSDEEKLSSAVSKAALFPAILWRTAVAVVVILAITRIRRLSMPSIGLSFRRIWLNIFLGLGLFILIFVAVIVFALLINIFFPRLNEEFQENAQMIMDAVPRVSAAGFVLISLSIGLYEELIFRGFLMPRLRRASGSWILAVLITTAVFAVLHLQDQAPAALLAITALSLAFSTITILRHSIIPAIIAHALFDLYMFLQLAYAAGDQWT